MRQLEEHLAKWVEQGFLSEEQKEKIQQFEATESRAKGGNRVLYAFLILGISIIGIGIVSLIAVNWEQIDSSIKLGGDFLFLILLAAGIYKAHTLQKDLLFDVVSTLFILSCLASIGLISQIYHTGGEIYQALLLWSIIIFPLTVLSCKGFIPHLWVFGFLAMCVAWVFSPDSWWYQDRRYGDHYFPFLLAFPLFAYFLANVSHLIKGGQRFSRAFHFWTVVLAFAAIGATDVYYSFSLTTIDFKFHDFLPVFPLTGLCIVILFLRKDLPKKTRIVAALIVVAPLVIYLPAILHFISNEVEGAYSFQHEYRETNEIVGAFCTVALCFLFGLYFTLNNQQRLFNLMTLLIGIRFLIVYFQVIGDLALTGLGLIVSGVFIIAVSLLWYKTKDRFSVWIRGVVQ